MTATLPQAQRDVQASPADAVRERSERTASAGARSLPRGVTRGESGKVGEQGVKVDWLNVTFDRPEMSPEGVVALLGCFLGRPTWGVHRGGLFGFETRLVLYAYVGAVSEEVGSLAYGGDAQRGRWLLQLTGRGCAHVADWHGLQSWLEDLKATITRIDLALDLLNGEFTVDDARDMYERGQFNSNGRPPSSEVAGDWLECRKGRTLYVGRGVNGKMLRVYEKGKQLGALDSPWVRYEVQLGNRDRVIPFEAITDRDNFFAGCYPALASMLDFAGETIPTTRKETKVTLAFLLHHLRRCYGKLIDSTLRASPVQHTDLIEEVRVIGTPRRLKASGVVAGVEWADVQASVRSY